MELKKKRKLMATTKVRAWAWITKRALKNEKEVLRRGEGDMKEAKWDVDEDQDLMHNSEKGSVERLLEKMEYRKDVRVM